MSYYSPVMLRKTYLCMYAWVKLTHQYAIVWAASVKNVNCPTIIITIIIIIIIMKL